MAREAHPRWGPKKLHVVVKRRFGEETPSESTIARILRRFGQVRAKRARRPLSTVERAPQVVAAAPNDVWTVDFKGWWRSLDGYRCEPLTVRDAFSRYILAVEVLESTAEAGAREVFERLFRKHGLPSALQCDNGTPFISVKGRGGLTRLSAWWVSLGIKVVRSRLASPQDNGGHERMHADISGDVQAFPAATRELQQRALTKWQKEFNHVRPHEALGGKVPAELYKPSVRRRLDQPKHKYPEHWILRNVVGKTGQIGLEGQVYMVGRALTGHSVALEPLTGLRHRIWFRDLDLGEIGDRTTSPDDRFRRRRLLGASVSETQPPKTVQERFFRDRWGSAIPLLRRLTACKSPPKPPSTAPRHLLPADPGKLCRQLGGPRCPTCLMASY